MDQHKVDLINNSLLKAVDALDNANLSIINNSFNAAQNRIYYAVFYSVMALAYLDGFTTSKHTELQGWFNKKYIYEDKVFDDSIYKIYKIIYEDRMKYDYDVLKTPEKETLLKEFNEAKLFVKNISDYIKSKIEVK